MSLHNYTNPAFFLDEAQSRSSTVQQAPKIVHTSPARVLRSESFRSFHSAASNNRSHRVGLQRVNSGSNLNCSHHQLHQQTVPLPSRLGHPKPISTSILEGVLTFPGENRSSYDVYSQSSGRYALVPVEELNKSSHAKFMPPQTGSRFVKSQDNLDHLDGLDELPYNFSDQFLSLPSNSSPNKENEMLPAFSTDFGSKSFILFDQISQQRYAVVPTEENEEIVDENHEIIQIHNGRKHRYAVIPTDEEETCLNGDLAASAQVLSMSRRTTPQKQFLRNRIDEQPSGPSTPKKNMLATQKLHEILTTPQRQSPLLRHSSTPLSPSESPYRVRPYHASYPKLTSNTPRKANDFAPQRLQYDQNNRMTSSATLNMDQRTTAVIQPRLQSAASIYNETTLTNTESTEKSWNRHLENHKRSVQTIGVVSLMLMFCGVVNSALCIYMTSMSSISALYVSMSMKCIYQDYLIMKFENCILKTGRSFFLDIGIVSGFGTVALSFLGFKFRFTDWTPNRNYISG